MRDGDSWERSDGDVPFCSSLMCCALFNVMKYLCRWSRMIVCRRTMDGRVEVNGWTCGVRTALGFLGRPALIELQFSAFFYQTARLSVHEHGLQSSDKFHVAAR